MKSNRRSVLIGLGALTVGGGAVFGTGAFSSVDANRSVSVTTAGDADALLAFDVETDFNGVDDGGADVVEFNFGEETGLNEEATTRFEDVLTVTNNGNDDVELSVENLPEELTFFYDDNGSETALGETVIQDADSEDNVLDLTVEIDLNGDPSINDEEITLTATTDFS